MNLLVHESETAVEIDGEFEQIDGMLKRVIENPAAGLVQNDGARISYQEYGVERGARMLLIACC